MEEILHQLIGGLSMFITFYPIIHRVSQFQPSFQCRFSAIKSRNPIPLCQSHSHHAIVILCTVQNGDGFHLFWCGVPLENVYHTQSQSTIQDFIDDASIHFSGFTTFYICVRTNVHLFGCCHWCRHKSIDSWKSQSSQAPNVTVSAAKLRFPMGQQAERESLGDGDVNWRPDVSRCWR